MKQLLKFLEGNENSQQAFLSNNTKEGKQKIEDLLKKHQNNVYALDQNLTKEQLKDYEKEFEKLGVDFSVTKNGKDNYSFFFSAGQSNVIEKALKNVVELKSAVLENEKVKSAENALDSLKDNMSLESVDKVKNVFDEIHDLKEKKSQLTEQLNGLENELNTQIKELDTLLDEKVNSLSGEEKELLAKYEDVSEIKNDVKEAIIKETEINEPKNSEVLDNPNDSKETVSEKGTVKGKVEKKTKIEFSLNGVKKIDKEIKEQSALEDKNKVKEKDLSL